MSDELTFCEFKNILEICFITWLGKISAAGSYFDMDIFTCVPTQVNTICNTVRLSPTGVNYSKTNIILEENKVIDIRLRQIKSERTVTGLMGDIYFEAENDNGVNLTRYAVAPLITLSSYQPILDYVRKLPKNLLLEYIHEVKVDRPMEDIKRRLDLS